MSFRGESSESKRSSVVRKEIAGFGAADEALVAALHALDDAVNYRDWIFELTLPHLTRAASILEVGAGRGTFTHLLAELSPTCAIEPGPSAFAALASRFADHPDVRAFQIGTTELGQLKGECFDVVFLSNVLEHIDDDVAALKALRGVLRPGGRIVVFSPAFELLYSNFDATVGHFHRYRKDELVRRMEQAGLRVVEARYVNSIGFFTWLFYVRLLRRSPADAVAVRLFDRFVVPVLRRLEAQLPPPFGQSVFAVGERGTLG